MGQLDVSPVLPGYLHQIVKDCGRLDQAAISVV